MAGLTLKPELFLYFYMASCVAVLIFNIAYIFIDKYQQKYLVKKRLDMVDLLQVQVDEIKNGNKVSKQHIDWLVRNLKKLKRLKTFENSLRELEKGTSRDLCDSYLKQIRVVFIRLIKTYEKRDVIEKAYFANLIEKFRIDQGQETMDPLIEFMAQLTINKDVFVRENSLRAIFSIGNKDAVLSAWEKMQANYTKHNEKLLADGLLRYTGNKEELITLLFKYREDFDTNLLLPILQFIRFYSGDYQEECRMLLQKETTDKELRIETLRYFRKYPYAPVREDIQRFVRYQEYVDWEYVAVAAQALSAYPGSDTVSCLKKGLRASNWYIRLNCAEALIINMKIPQVELFDIYNGTDRYAREILQYVSDKFDIEKQEMELSEGLV